MITTSEINKRVKVVNACAYYGCIGTVKRIDIDDCVWVLLDSTRQLHWFNSPELVYYEQSMRWGVRYYYPVNNQKTGSGAWSIGSPWNSNDHRWFDDLNRAHAFASSQRGICGSSYIFEVEEYTEET